MNSINIPRYYNGNLVYDEIPMNSIITTSTLGYSYINSNNNGILVKNNNDISFKTFNGILYYKNNELKDCALRDNTLLCTDGAGTLSQINIGGGVLNTYKFDDNSVDTSNQDPSFTNKIVLNNCEIVDDSNQRINKNYLIYGNGIEHGLSPIELDTPSNNYEYYYIVNDSNKAINVSTSSQIYTNLYDKITKEGNSQKISAIPICNSTDNQHLSLSLIIPQYYNNGNYYIKSDGSYFSLETIYGSILPSSLKIYTKDFNYSNNKILTIGKNNSNEDVFIPIQSSTSLKKPYLSGTGWGDLTYTTFLNSNNLSITKSLIYSNPVVIGTNGSMYGVILPENKKYILTKSSFKELSITGNDLYINNYPSLNLHKIIQVDNDILSTLSDTTNTEIGLLHTKDTGEISISKLTNEDISNNAITTDKIANNAITGNKLLFNDLQTINNWSNIIIDTNGNLYNKHGDFFTNSNKFGVFNWQGDIQSLCANIITEGTMHGNRITQNTLKYDRLNISNDPQTSSWSIIEVNSNNNFITIPNTISVYNNYGVFDYNGNIQSLCANIITEGTMNGDRISEETLQYNRLKISTDPQTSNWSIIAVNSNNNFIKFSNTLSLNNQYGIFDNKGNIVQLTADKISGTINSNMIENGSIGSIKLGTSSVTTEKIYNNAVTGDKIAPGAVGETQIANNSITSSKLNINGTKPSGTWKNLLIDNNNNFVTTGASVTHYGVFNNIGGVQDLNSAVLNDIGLKLYIPDGNDNEFNQTFVSTNCIFYTNNINDIVINTDYMKVYNYYNSNNSSNKIIYINNPDQFADTYSNIRNTYNIFYSIFDQNNMYNIKLKTSLYIKNIHIDLTSINSNFYYKNLQDTLLKSGTILIVGVYTSLCKLKDPTQILMLNEKLYKYSYNINNNYSTDISNYCKATLLGYIPIDINATVEVGKTNNIIIDKTFDFECTVNPPETINLDDDVNKIKDDLLFFVPLYYYKNNTAIGLNYGDRIFTKINGESTSASIYYTNMCLNNDNTFTITCTGKYVTIDKLTISSSDITINDDSITINNYNSKYNINHNGGIFYIGTDSNYNNFMNVNDIPVDDLIYIQNNGNAQTLTFEYFLNEPIEKNIKISLSPITKQSNIIYIIKDNNTNELNKTITYKLSLCSIEISLTKNIGEYPTQFKMS